MLLPGERVRTGPRRGATGTHGHGGQEALPPRGEAAVGAEPPRGPPGPDAPGVSRLAASSLSPAGGAAGASPAVSP